MDNITYDELAPKGMTLMRCQLTGASSTITTTEHKMGTVKGHIVVAEGTNGATSTISGSTITVTGTNNDYVDVIVWGVK